MSKDRGKEKIRLRDFLDSVITPLCVLACGLLAAPAFAQSLDLELYAEVLAKHTQRAEETVGTEVDYAALRKSTDFSRLVASLSNASLRALSGTNERKAFWINAYNILAIDMVVRNDPEESIRDIGSFIRPVWKLEAGSIDGQPYTLEHIEHEILRKTSDPRIHAAIVCASTSCPSLRREPYRAQGLDDQLDDAFRGFVSDRNKGARPDASHGVLYLSKIFDWFEEDWEARGGVVAEISRFASGDLDKFLRRHRASITIRHLPYDWRLNAYSPPPRTE